MTRAIAIGDIHGYSRALQILLTAIEPGPEDTMVTLGDYIDWGPDSRGVLDQLMALGKRCTVVCPGVVVGLWACPSPSGIRADRPCSVGPGGNHPARQQVRAGRHPCPEAGCTDTEILNHLRGPGPHVRGCHVLDALLGKA